MAASASGIRWTREGRDAYSCSRGRVVRAYSASRRDRGWHAHPNGDPRRIEPHWAGSPLHQAMADVERYGADA